MRVAVCAPTRIARTDVKPSTTPRARRVSMTAVRRHETVESEQSAVAAASSKLLMSLALSAALTLSPTAAIAIPQTSECATNSCDGNDYSGKKLAGTGAFFTKGSLKRANFNGADLTGITLFGADLTGATFVNANLTNANLGQANLTGADLTGANLSGAIVSSAQLEDVKIADSDWSDVIVRKDVQQSLCKVADGMNAETGNPTAMSLMC